jgi:hypothetical protein
MKYSINTIISIDKKYCGDFCPAMLNGEGEEHKHIYCGLFTDFEGNHRLKLDGENVLRHSLCIQKTRDKKNVIILNLDLTRKAMKAKGFNIQSLAKKMRCGKNTIGGWLNKRTYPTQPHLYKLAETLEISVNDLILD